MPHASSETSLAAIERALPGLAVSERAPDRISYARDLWPRHHIAVRAGRIAEHAPRAIAWPDSVAEVAELVRVCAAEGISVVPYGAGSGVCGGVLPTDKTVVIDLKRLSRWRRLAPEEGVLEIEAGALGIRLEEDLQRRGFTIGHFPSSILCSTVGGWVAARGAGQCSGLYGKIEDMVASLECVDGRGEIVTLKRRACGPDLTPLVIGSEGVLTVVTAASLRLHPAPVHRSFAAFEMASMERGWEAIRAIYQSGLRPAVCRLYDPFDSMLARRSLRKKPRGRRSASRLARELAPGLGGAAVRNLLRFPGALNQAIEALGARVFGGAMMVLVFEGERSRNEAELNEARRLAVGGGGKDLGEAPARHWLDSRYSVSYRQAPTIMLGAFVDTMEVAAPWSQLGALYDGVRGALGPHVMVMAHMSHAYPDGCSIYFTFAGSAESDAAAEARYDEAWQAAMQAAIAAGGTLSHHHGVGRSKAPQMGAELGLGIEVVGALRRAFDPAGVLNPGNLMPAAMPPRIPLPPAPSAPQLDRTSMLVHAAGSASLAEVARVLEAEGLSLGIAAGVDLGQSVAAWLAAGAPGRPDPWLDPVDHLVAGYAVELPRGGALVVRPCPRRAVGPDLWSLFLGTEGRAGRIHSVHLRARGRSAAPLEVGIERQPKIGDDEARWVERAIAAVAELE